MYVIHYRRSNTGLLRWRYGVQLVFCEWRNEDIKPPWSVRTKGCGLTLKYAFYTNFYHNVYPQSQSGRYCDNA